MLNEIKTRRLQFRELFKLGFSIFGKNLMAIFVVTAMVSIPFYIIFAFIPQELYITQQDILSQNAEKILKFSFVIFGINILFTPLSTAGYTYIAYQTMEGEKVKFTGILDATLIKWKRHIFTSLIFTAIILVSSILIIPAIFFCVVFTFYTSIVAITDVWGFKALTESHKLVRGKFLFTAGLMCITGFLSLFVKVLSGTFDIYENKIYDIMINVLYFTFTDFIISVFEIIMIIYFLNLYYINDNLKIKE